MNSDEEGDEVIGGKLMLKGGVTAKRKLKNKKKKKKSKKDKKKRKRGDQVDDEAGDVGNVGAEIEMVVGNISKKHIADDVKPEGLEPYVAPAMTKAELAFQARQRVRETERISKLASKTHRQKVEEYNEYLAGLSEIHDIPRVGPG